MLLLLLLPNYNSAELSFYHWIIVICIYSSVADADADPDPPGSEFRSGLGSDLSLYRKLKNFINTSAGRLVFERRSLNVFSCFV